MSEEPAVYQPHPAELELAHQQRDSWKKLASELGPEVQRLIHLCNEGATAVEGGKRISISYPHELNTDDAHQMAAQALADKLGWKGRLVGGGLKHGNCYVFVD